MLANFELILLIHGNLKKIGNLFAIHKTLIPFIQDSV